MSKDNSDACCPRFDPELWDGKEFQWAGKRFVKDRVRSFLHIPLNFTAVMKRNFDRIEAAGAKTETRLVLSHENSLWGANVYIEVTKDIPGADMAGIAGTFLCKVFEGPYRNMRKWIAQMKAFVASRGKSLQGLYFFYATCPKCAKKYGKNYVAMLARI